MKLRIGTRGSKLALAQSAWVGRQIEERYPDIRVSLVKIQTKGDRILDSPLSKIGGKGLFVKEIEEALLRGEVDLAVHSVKDLPAQLPEDLEVLVFPEREDPRDAFVSMAYDSLGALPRGARVGTGSLRRAAQVLHRRPDLEIVPLRGNVDTRLRKLKEQGLGALILAASGLHRLGLDGLIREYLPPDILLPAIGQGALGLEVRRGDGDVHRSIEFLNHEETKATVLAERALLFALEGGCQVPIAGYARMEGDKILLEGMVAELDGSRVIRDRMEGTAGASGDLGKTLAGRLLKAGAGGILDRIYGRGQSISEGEDG